MTFRPFPKLEFINSDKTPIMGKIRANNSIKPILNRSARIQISVTIKQKALIPQ